VWPLRLYHLAFRLAHAAHSRRQEYAADAYAVRQAGKEAAAAALIYLEVTERLPWSRLENIVKGCVANNQPLDSVFAEQVRLARATRPYEWEDACRKVLRVKTGRFDSHPALKERLAAGGGWPAGGGR